MRGDVGVIDGRTNVHRRLAEIADARLERHAHEHAADFEIFIGAQEASEADAELVARHGMREAEELHVRLVLAPHGAIPPEREDGDERDGKDGEHDILRIRIEAPASSPFSSR